LSDITKGLKSFLENYLGLKIDATYRGGIKVHKAIVNELSNDDWVKKEITKKIKPAVRSLPNSENIKAIKIPSNEGKLELLFIFKSNHRFTYVDKKNLRDQANKLLKDLGYNSEKVFVQN
jgi:divalent metal cation (Fe/Co/Zn/Cd) transporter